MEKTRKSERFPIAKVANITSNGVQNSAEVLVRDLSIQGMGCSGNVFYNQGDMVRVTLKLPSSSDDLIEESLIGKIAWVEAFEEEEEKQYAFGIEFDEMQEQNPRLFGYVKYLGELLI